MKTFSDLNLNKQLLAALEDNGFSTPTTIQERTFAPIMSGTDIIGIAQTGTGKTLAYLLPLLRMWKFSKSPYPTIMIIVPTRELVIQVVEQIEMLTQNMNFEVAAAYGGANIKRQIEDIQRGIDAVVGTPGRLYDLLLKGAIKANSIKKLVIDEVDEMLNLGFRIQVKHILEFLPEKRQSLMFSATMTEDVEYFIENFFMGPQKIEAAPMGTPLENIEQSAYKVQNFNTKVNLLKHLLEDSDEFSKVLVFMSTKKLADMVGVELEEKFENEFGVIHSNKSQNLRFNVINNFKDGTFRFVLATDVVARGIDVSEVSHVINFDCPDEPENYIHRIGRTGRADQSGRAITFITPTDEENFLAIEVLMETEVPKQELPEEVEVSDVLIPDELPQVKMPNVQIKRSKIRDAGEAFHEKKAKNQKTNLSRRELMKKRLSKKKIKGRKKRKK